MHFLWSETKSMSKDIEFLKSCKNVCTFDYKYTKATTKLNTNNTYMNIIKFTYCNGHEQKLTFPNFLQSNFVKGQEFRLAVFCVYIRTTCLPYFPITCLLRKQYFLCPVCVCALLAVISELKLWFCCRSLIVLYSWLCSYSGVSKCVLHLFGS